MSAVIHVVAKAGCEQAINVCYQAEVGEGFLIWTRSRIVAQIRAVNAGEVEALANLRGKLRTIEDWNRAVPERAEGCGSVLIADHEATLTPLQLVALRKYVLFIEKHSDKFKAVEGMDVAKMLLGGAGRKGIGVLAPGEPKSEIYVLCVRHRKLDLWAQFYRFRSEPSKHTWSGLKAQTVPWLTDRTVESLVKLAGHNAQEEFPSLLVVRRALLPAKSPVLGKSTRGVVKHLPRK